jgi:hypothetical protein
VPGPSASPWDRYVEDVAPEHVRLWGSPWARALKTKANYHGLPFGVFARADQEHARTHAGHPEPRPFRQGPPSRQNRADLAHEAESKPFSYTSMAGAPATSSGETQGLVSGQASFQWFPRRRGNCPMPL